MVSLRPYASLLLLLISSLTSLESTIAAESASVFFLDSPTRHYFRSPSDVNALTESETLSTTEVTASLSVLLGTMPPSTLTAAGSMKLNKVLLPNPFDRPHAVFALEVTGTEDLQHVDSPDNSHFRGALRSQLEMSENKAGIHLHEENQVSVIYLNSLLTFDADKEYSDDDMNDVATFFGGSYRADYLPLKGEFLIPLASGANLRLDLSKKADREYTTSLVSLIRSIRRAVDLRQDIAASVHVYPELITGTFNGIKALQEHYGSEGVTKLGLELFVSSISKIFDSLQAAYGGEIVGVVVQSGSVPTSLMNVKVSSHSSARLLEEAKGASEVTAVAEAVLVRRIVAWTTGLMLIIATLLGIYFLLNMPLTRDTLLYSNVKLD